MNSSTIKLSKILRLSYQKSLFFVKDFDEMNLTMLKKVIKYQKIIPNLTEELAITNVFFDNKSELTKIRRFERIATRLYSEILSLEYINSKDVLVSFPEIMGRPKFFNAAERGVEAIFTYNFKHDDSEELNSYLRDQKIIVPNIHNLEEIDDIEELKENIEPLASSELDDYNVQAFDKVIVGGSFDRIHFGHNVLMSTTALLGKQIILGLTSDDMISKKEQIVWLQSFELRKEHVIDKMRQIGCDMTNFILFPISGTAGGAGSMADLGALVLTEETMPGGHIVNETRKQNNLPPVPLIKADLIRGTSSSDKVSSTQKRSEMKNDVNNIENLKAKWEQLSNALNLTPTLSHLWFSKIRDYYQQLWRKYHTLNHIDRFTDLAHKAFDEGKIKDFVNVLLTIWFHDIIYVPTRGDNEDRSVVVFDQFLEEISKVKDVVKLDLIDREKIAKYIMCTKHHFTETKYDDNDLNYILDFDLFEFSNSDFETYYEYSKKIKFEFSFYSDEQFRNGRATFLEKVLSKSYIFRTEEFHTKYEAIARKNVAQEIERLRSGKD